LKSDGNDQILASLHFVGISTIHAFGDLLLVEGFWELRLEISNQKKSNAIEETQPGGALRPWSAKCLKMGLE
jgi:hypothetical protein